MKPTKKHSESDEFGLPNLHGAAEESKLIDANLSSD